VLSTEKRLQVIIIVAIWPRFVQLTGSIHSNQCKLRHICAVIFHANCINLISVWYLTVLIATKLSGSYVPSTEKRLQVILFAAIWPRFVLIQFILAWPTLFAERKIWTDINTYSFKMILNLSTAIFHWKYVHLVH